MRLSLLTLLALTLTAGVVLGLNLHGTSSNAVIAYQQLGQDNVPIRSTERHTGWPRPLFELDASRLYPSPEDLPVAWELNWAALASNLAAAAACLLVVGTLTESLVRHSNSKLKPQP